MAQSGLRLCLNLGQASGVLIYVPSLSLKKEKKKSRYWLVKIYSKTFLKENTVLR